MTTAKVLIEPKIKRNLLFRCLVTRNKLITHTLKNTQMSLKVTNKENFTINKMKLPKIILEGSNINYRKEFKFEEELNLEDIKPNKSKETETFKVFFTIPGLYWLTTKVEIPPGELKADTMRSTLEGYEEKGWPDSNNTDFCKSPIAVVDLLTSSMKYLTVATLLLTMLIVFLTIFKS